MLLLYSINIMLGSIKGFMSSSSGGPVESGGLKTILSSTGGMQAEVSLFHLH